MDFAIIRTVIIYGGKAVMDYNENEFKEKANRKARRIWFVFAILLSANYGSDVSKGLNT